MSGRAALLSVALLAAACASSTQRASSSDVSVEGAFFALSVGDVDRVAEWYSENLGFDIKRRGEIPGGGPKFAILSRAGTLLEILQFTEAKSRGDCGLPADAQKFRGIFKIGLQVSDIDALFSRVQSRNLDVFFPLVQARDVPLRTFGLKDAEGNIVQFFGK